jgi:hypothetical protein
VSIGDWITLNGGITYKLHVDRRLRFSITYLGRTRVAFGGGSMRWKVQDHSQVEGLNDIPEFSSLDEAKAWAISIVMLT